jgi:hypothetical protein
MLLFQHPCHIIICDAFGWWKKKHSQVSAEQILKFGTKCSISICFLVQGVDYNLMSLKLDDCFHQRSLDTEVVKVKNSTMRPVLWTLSLMRSVVTKGHVALSGVHFQCRSIVKDSYCYMSHFINFLFQEIVKY